MHQVRCAHADSTHPCFFLRHSISNELQDEVERQQRRDGEERYAARNPKQTQKKNRKKSKKYGDKRRTQKKQQIGDALITPFGTESDDEHKGKTKVTKIALELPAKRPSSRRSIRSISAAPTVVRAVSHSSLSPQQRTLGCVHHHGSNKEPQS